jgi:hypothetical protein
VAADAIPAGAGLGGCDWQDMNPVIIQKKASSIDFMAVQNWFAYINVGFCLLFCRIWKSRFGIGNLINVFMIDLKTQSPIPNS